MIRSPMTWFTMPCSGGGFHHPLRDEVEDLSRLLEIAVGDKLQRALEIGKEDGDELRFSLESAHLPPSAAWTPAAYSISTHSFTSKRPKFKGMKASSWGGHFTLF